MALPDLLEALREQAAERRAEELARAEAEVARIRAESRSSCEGRRGDYVERVRRDEEEAARRAVSRAEREAAESVLVARQRLLARVEAALRSRAARAASDPRYLRALPDEVRGALARLPSGDVVLRARPELLTVVREALGDRKDVAVEAAPELGTGFAAMASGTGVEVDGTLESRLDHSWPTLAAHVLRELAS